MSANDETYSGWPNRETWAVALYLDNDREWYDAWRAALRTMRREDDENSWFGLSRAGDVLRALVTDRLDALDDPAQRTSELIGIARDIGSLWRVDWTALGREYLARLAEDDES